MNLFDFEHDFTEEEESVFTTVVARAGTGKTLEMKVKEIVAKYKAGVTVTQILKEYRISTGRLYEILKDNSVPLRGGSNHVGSTKPANLFKKAITTTGTLYTSDMAERYGLTPGQVRSYCLVLEGQGYQFNRIQRGQRDARVFSQKDINVLDRMIEELRMHSMIESAVLALYNHDVQPPKVDVRLEGETLFINIKRTPKWTADEINVTINLKEEK